MKRSEIFNIILGVIGIAGLLAVAAVAPNVLQVLGKLPGTRRYFSSHVRSRIQRLHDLDFIEFAEFRGRRVIRLTSKGKRELERYRLSEQIPSPRSWDGKWRVIIFDIHEYRRNTRDKIRRDLMRFGFKHLQHSVWVYPHDCNDIIALLKADHHIGKELLCITADTIENDRWLKQEFSLTSETMKSDD